jgi:hypothetical protein
MANSTPDTPDVNEPFPVVVGALGWSGRAVVFVVE